MRLVTYGWKGRRRLGAIVDGEVVDLPGLVGHPAFPSSMEALVARPRGTVMDAARAALERTDELPDWTVPDADLLAPILPPSLSQEEHRWVVGPDEVIQRPPGNGDACFDLEIAAVVFRPKKPKLRPSDARGCIFGYTLMQSWFNHDAFAAALGPCIVTSDEFDETLPVTATVNGRRWSEGLVEEAEVDFSTQIVAASRIQQLLPGEVFGSGTIGRTHPERKAPRPGAEVEISHPSIGTLYNKVAGRIRRRKAS